MSCKHTNGRVVCPHDNGPLPCSASLCLPGADNRDCTIPCACKPDAGGNTYTEDMPLLPIGLTCADCANHRLCRERVKLFSETWMRCAFSPSRFCPDGDGVAVALKALQASQRNSARVQARVDEFTQWISARYALQCQEPHELRMIMAKLRELGLIEETKYLDEGEAT